MTFFYLERESSWIATLAYGQDDTRLLALFTYQYSHILVLLHWSQKQHAKHFCICSFFNIIVRPCGFVKISVTSGISDNSYFKNINGFTTSLPFPFSFVLIFEWNAFDLFVMNQCFLSYELLWWENIYSEMLLEWVEFNGLTSRTIFRTHSPQPQLVAYPTSERWTCAKGNCSATGAAFACSY